jgi:hypothetical protein
LQGEAVAVTVSLKNTLSENDKHSLKVNLIVFSSIFLLYLITVIILPILAFGIRNIGNYYFSSRLIAPFAILGYLFIYLKAIIKKENIKALLTIGIDFIIFFMLATVILLAVNTISSIQYLIEQLLLLLT